ncbi:MAG: hypothetical protein WC341_08605 [Bacteroidales bacterium]|jgi:hypothetical protein
MKMKYVIIVLAILLGRLMAKAQTDTCLVKGDSTLVNLMLSYTTEKHDFEYYQQTYNESMHISHNGMIMTFAGAVACGAGIYIGESGNGGFIGAVLFLGGGLMANAGIPIWISSGIKAANNRAAMERCKKDISLSFGGTPNGIGFRVKLN